MSEHYAHEGLEIRFEDLPKTTGGAKGIVYGTYGTKVVFREFTDFEVLRF